MQETLEILPGIRLRCCKASRFKQAALSIQFVSPMAEETAALNALLPAVLLRGCRAYTDIQPITEHLDDLYGASVGALVRRIGDYQTTGLYCGFIEDRFALAGDEILAPMIDFARQLLLEPLMEDGAFCNEFVESEKKNLISTIESQRSDKRAYAAARLLENMCAGDSYAIPRLGTVPQVQAIDREKLYVHYRKLLRESPVELFYVGSGEAEQVAALLRPVFAPLERSVLPIPAQTAFRGGTGSHESESMEVAQGKLCLGFTTPITNQDSRFAAMQLCNSIFGGGMQNKIFNRIREELSLCYEIASGYYGSKGILTVGAGIDFDKREAVQAEILGQLQAMQTGSISQQELAAAKESILSSLRAIFDSPGAVESFFSTAALSGLGRDPQQYGRQIQAVTVQDVVEAACSISLHSSFFLKGDDHGA